MLYFPSTWLFSNHQFVLFNPFNFFTHHENFYKCVFEPNWCQWPKTKISCFCVLCFLSFNHSMSLDWRICWMTYYCHFVIVFCYFCSYFLSSLAFCVCVCDLILFLERDRWREGERGEKLQCVVASHVPPTGDLACSSDMCPSLGIKLVTLWFTGQRLIYWATPTRTDLILFYSGMIWFLSLLCIHYIGLC